MSAERASSRNLTPSAQRAKRDQLSAIRRTVYRRTGLLLALALTLIASAAFASAAQAEVTWRVNSLASTTAPAEGTIKYYVQITDAGLSPAEGSVNPVAFSGTFPEGLAVGSVAYLAGVEGGGWNCSVSGDAHSFSCLNETAYFEPVIYAGSQTTFAVEASVDPSAQAGEVLTARYEASGGALAAASGSTADPTTVAPQAPPFGIDGFDNTASGASGATFATAATHPYQLTTSLDFNTETNPGSAKGVAWPVQPPRDVVVDLPPGLLGDLATLPRCTADQLMNIESLVIKPLCQAGSQVGTSILHVTAGFVTRPVDSAVLGPMGVYNLVPPPGVAARLGFQYGGVLAVIDFSLRSASGYGVQATIRGIPEGLAIAGSTLSIWGKPADASHLADRHCPGHEEPAVSDPARCAGEGAAQILRMPTSCTGAGEGLPTSAYTDSWFNPGAFDENGEPLSGDPSWQSSTSVSHEAPGYPWPRGEWGPPVGVSGCGGVHFDPSFSAQATTDVADASSGLDVHVGVPQNCWDEEAEGYEPTCQSDLRDAEVRLPAGMTLNPSEASGLQACTPSQVGLTSQPGETPIAFDGKPANCPEASKIGKVRIVSPLLEEELTGGVYLAKQGDNPFNSLLAMYLVAEAPERGVIVKQAGEIETGPGGRLTTVFKDAPQLPFSDLNVSLFGGSRAPLRTPSSCGTYAVTAKLTPWSGNAAANLGDGFEIEKCPNSGFDPKLEAGTQNPLAGQTSPFALRLSREDGSQELGGLSATLPPGLSGYLKGIPYCPDSALAAVSGEEGTGAAQEANPSCPAASLVGRVTVGAGAGPEPFFTKSGRAYLAGPYKGAPLSLAVVAPAVAGPFDLGSVVVRNALEVNPETAQITAVSDPLPTILHGIPLDLRDVRVELNREHFTLNPTSCEPMSVDSTLTSIQGASASPSARFQAAGCDRLGFKPKLSLALKGKHTRGAHPALHAVLTMPATGQANVARAAVTLPGTELLEQGHIRTTCTRVQYAAGGGGGEQCPAGSVYGHAKAWTPLLDKPLEGPVFLRSNGGERELPDLVASLGGQIHIDLVGYIDSVHARIRNTFAVVPDAPVTKFVLDMQGGSKSLLVNSTNLCKARPHATALFDAHNGKIHDIAPLVTAGCGGRRHGGGKR